MKLSRGGPELEQDLDLEIQPDLSPEELQLKQTQIEKEISERKQAYSEPIRTSFSEHLQRFPEIEAVYTELPRVERESLEEALQDKVARSGIEGEHIENVFVHRDTGDLIAILSNGQEFSYKEVRLDPQEVLGYSFDKAKFIERLQDPDSRGSFYDSSLRIGVDGRRANPSALYGPVDYEVQAGDSLASIGKKLCPEDPKAGSYYALQRLQEEYGTFPKQGGVFFDRKSGHYIIHPGQKLTLDLSQELPEHLKKAGRAFARQESLEYQIEEVRRQAREQAEYARQLARESQLQAAHEKPSIDGTMVVQALAMQNPYMAATIPVSPLFTAPIPKVQAQLNNALKQGNLEIPLEQVLSQRPAEVIPSLQAEKLDASSWYQPYMDKMGSLYQQGKESLRVSADDDSWGAYAKRRVASALAIGESAYEFGSDAVQGTIGLIQAGDRLIADAGILTGSQLGILSPSDPLVKQSRQNMLERGQTLNQILEKGEQGYAIAKDRFGDYVRDPNVLLSDVTGLKNWGGKKLQEFDQALQEGDVAGQKGLYRAGLEVGTLVVPLGAGLKLSKVEKIGELAVKQERVLVESSAHTRNILEDFSEKAKQLGSNQIRLNDYIREDKEAINHIGKQLQVLEAEAKALEEKRYPVLFSGKEKALDQAKQVEITENIERLGKAKAFEEAKLDNHLNIQTLTDLSREHVDNISHYYQKLAKQIDELRSLEVSGQSHLALRQKQIEVAQQSQILLKTYEEQ
ncbi:hypothetical protein GKC56_02295, partial [Neisseriaceae bacterium PsAf]|nr:hypothetical protein [Neisseriaceae bacterium PsAf]